MITVKMNEADVVNMLVDRVRFWTDDEDIIDLYQKMYANLMDSGIKLDLDVKAIVDNDYVNYCSVIFPEDEDFEEILKLYKEGGRDISCEGYGYSFVEAVSDDETKILVRY